MNGNDRRRMELEHPENTLTLEEKEYRKQIMTQMLNKGIKKCKSIMIIGIFIVIILLSKFDGVERFYISFFGTIFVVLLGFYIAYNMEIKLNKNI